MYVDYVGEPIYRVCDINHANGGSLSFLLNMVIPCQVLIIFLIKKGVTTIP